MDQKNTLQAEETPLKNRVLKFLFASLIVFVAIKAIFIFIWIPELWGINILHYVWLPLALLLTLIPVTSIPRVRRCLTLLVRRYGVQPSGGQYGGDRGPAARRGDCPTVGGPATDTGTTAGATDVPCHWMEAASQDGAGTRPVMHVTYRHPAPR